MKKTLTKTDFQRQAMENLAGQAHIYHFADKALARTSEDVMKCSGVIITITALGGKTLIEPVLIRDGLSKDTIEALRAELRKSYTLATLYKPSGM